MNETSLDETSRATPLENRIIHNFYLSFKFSQGEAQIQERLLVAVSRLYPREDFIREFPKAQIVKDRLGSRIEKLRLPKKHGKGESGEEINNEKADANFNQEWSNQLEIFAATQTGEIKKDESEDSSRSYVLSRSPQELLGHILITMADRDGVFVGKGRPGREKDKYESFIKTYIVDRAPTTSPEFDQVFSQARELVVRAFTPNDMMDDVVNGKRIKDNLLLLQNQWKERHPGEEFFDPSKAA